MGVGDLPFSVGLQEEKVWAVASGRRGRRVTGRFNSERIRIAKIGVVR